MTERCWVDGEEGGHVPADDRGLNLSDGVFETLRIRDGLAACFSLHQARLEAGLGCLGFHSPRALATDALCSAITWVTGDDSSPSGILRVTVTRGSGPRGYRAPVSPTVRIIARFSPDQPVFGEPARLVIAPIHYSAQPHFHGAKLLARVEQVLATSWAQQQGYDDVLMTSDQGEWVSGGSGNLFLRIGRTLYTPPILAMGIAGTRRQLILSRLADVCGYSVEVQPCNASTAEAANEAFLCNAVVGIRSVKTVGDREFPSHEAAIALEGRIHDWDDTWPERR